MISHEIFTKKKDLLSKLKESIKRKLHNDCDTSFYISK